MKMADVLRDIADMLDQKLDSGHQTPKAPGLTPVEVEKPEEVECGTMVPPLQQKLELLKKASGVESHFDNKGSDELEDIKKLTGIKAVIAQEAGEDNDIVG